jgi:hypothetical protein
MTAVGSDEDAEVVVEVTLLLLSPVAVDEAEVAIVEAAPVDAVEIASSGCSWSCSSSEEAEAETKVASPSPSAQCLSMSAKGAQTGNNRTSERLQYTGMEVAVIEEIREVFLSVFGRCHFPFFTALEAKKPFLSM